MEAVSFLGLSLLVYKISLFVFLALDVALLYYVLDLLIFHIRLKIEGNTTSMCYILITRSYSHFKNLDRTEREKKARESLRREKSSDSIKSAHFRMASFCSRFEQGK